jgi:hypothetical protein
MKSRDVVKTKNRQISIDLAMFSSTVKRFLFKVCAASELFSGGIFRETIDALRLALYDV